MSPDGCVQTSNFQLPTSNFPGRVMSAPAASASTPSKIHLPLQGYDHGDEDDLDREDVSTWHASATDRRARERLQRTQTLEVRGAATHPKSQQPSRSAKAHQPAVGSRERHCRSRRGDSEKVRSCAAEV
jgi:hypothetical protein